MCVSFNGNPCTTIVSYYSPNNASDETVIITFNNNLYPLVRHIPKDNFLMICGDMNAQIGKTEITYSSYKNGQIEIRNI